MPQTKIIDRLLADQTTTTKNYLFLSAYLPLRQNNPTPINHQKANKLATAAIVEVLKKNSQTGTLKHLHQAVNYSLQNQINRLDTIPPGLAVFIKLNLDHLQQKREQDLPSQSFTLVSLPFPPEKQVHLGRSYHLTQLLLAQSLDPTSLILSLQQQEARFYQLHRHELSLLAQINNQYLSSLTPNTNESLDIYRPTSQKKAVYSTGKDKVDRSRDHANQLFIQELTQFLKDTLPKNFTYDYFIIFYSHALADYLDSLTQSNLVTSNFTPLLVAKTLNHSLNEIKHTTLKHIESYVKQTKINLYQQSMNTSGLFVSGWSTVLEAARQRNVRTLFIKPTAKQKGYIVNPQLLYLKKPELSPTLKVTNLTPWLVNAVLNQNGQIVVMKGISMQKKGPVAALLRHA